MRPTLSSWYRVDERIVIRALLTLKCVDLICVICDNEHMSGKEMVKKFKRAGWVLSRVNGSHHIMKKGSASFSIPVHANRDLSKGLEKAALKTLKEVG